MPKAVMEKSRGYVLNGPISKIIRECDYSIVGDNTGEEKRYAQTDIYEKTGLVRFHNFFVIDKQEYSDDYDRKHKYVEHLRQNLHFDGIGTEYGND